MAVGEECKDGRPLRDFPSVTRLVRMVRAMLGSPRR